MILEDVYVTTIKGDVIKHIGVTLIENDNNIEIFRNYGEDNQNRVVYPIHNIIEYYVKSHSEIKGGG